MTTLYEVANPTTARNNSMSSFSRLTYHIVFSTKFRKPTIKPEHQEQIYQYIGGIIRSNQGSLIEIGGTNDHVHILGSLKPSVSVSKIVQEIKGSSSKWINETIKLDSPFEWQKGYGVFSVSYSGVQTVQHYIQNQEEHHRTRSFNRRARCIIKSARHRFRGSLLVRE